MPKCPHHPNEEADFVCLKDTAYFCSRCAECRNPTLYCKFRESCIIWYHERDKGRRRGREGSSEGGQR